MNVGRKQFGFVALCAVIAVTAIEAQAGGGGAFKTQLVSRQSQSAGGAGADSGSFAPAVSASGRIVAFETDADNLGGPSDDGFSNIYAYDRKTKRVQLISRRSGAGGTGANDDSFSPEISDNGRFIAYSTEATNLGGPLNTDPNVEENVYVYDRKERKTQLVSRRNKAAGGNETSFDASLSASGRYVSFESEATNLGGPTQTDPGESNVYVYDRKRGKTQLVSRRSGRSGAGANATSSAVAGGGLSAGGRYVVYSTEATNLGGPTQTDPLNFDQNVYLYDRKQRKTRLVSRRSGKNGVGGNDSSVDPHISANGRFVAFEFDGTNLGGPIQTDPNNGESNIYVYDLTKRKVALVSRRSKNADGLGGNDSSDDPVISANGRLVTFESEAENLGGANGDDDDVFVYDRKRKKLTLVGRASGRNGAPCDTDDCDNPYISANGLFVAFEAEADNLGGPADTSVDNIYVRSLK